MSVPFQMISASVPFDGVEAEFAKDIWDARVIPGVRYDVRQSSYFLNFTVIPSSFRAVTKRYIRFMLTRYSQHDCYRRLRYLQLFFAFFTVQHPEATTLQDLRREDIEAYLNHLSSAKGSLNRTGKKIGKEHVWRGVNLLKQFMEYLERISSPQAPLVPLAKLIWPGDGGTFPQNNYNEVKYIPEYVLVQLEQHMHTLPAKHLPIVVC
jgi:hypothetical protein